MRSFLNAGSVLVIVTSLLAAMIWPTGLMVSAADPPYCSLAYVQQVEAKVFTKTNAERTSRGLPAFKPMASVSSVARTWSQYMSVGHRYWHNPAYSEQVPADWFAVAENIHSVYTESCNSEAIATQLVSDWMDSPGHRANILDPSLQYLGTGAWPGLWIPPGFGSQWMTYSTQNFASYYPQTTPPQSGTVSLSPAVAPSKSVVLISGGGYRPNERVNIRWGSTGGQLLGYLTTDQHGAFRGKITTPVANPASYRVFTVGAISGIMGSRYLQITSNSTTASVAVSPSQGAALSVPIVTGSGFRPDEIVYVYWGGANGTLRARVNARPDGTFSAKITVPNSGFGSYQIYVRGGSSNTLATTLYRIQGSPGVTFTLNPTQGKFGSVAGFTGSGMQPSERVNIRWGSPTGQILGYVTASPTGTFAGRITIPGATPGSHLVYAEGMSSKRSSRTYFSLPIPAQAELQQSPNPVQPGKVVRITGSGFAPYEMVDLIWNAPGGLAGYVKASPAGTINGAITVPTSGAYEITGTGRASTATGSIGLNLTSYQSASITMGTPAAVESSATPAAELDSTPVTIEEIVEEPVDTEIEDGESTPEPTDEIVEEPVDTEVDEGGSTPQPTEEIVEEPVDTEIGDGESTPEPTEEIAGEPVDTEVDEGESTPEPTEDIVEGPVDTEVDEGESTPEPTEEIVEKSESITPPVPTAEPTAPPYATDVAISVVDTAGIGVLDACVQLIHADGWMAHESCDTSLGGAADGDVLVRNVVEGNYTLRITNLSSGIKPVADQPIWVGWGMTNPVVVVTTPVPPVLPEPVEDDTDAQAEDASGVPTESEKDQRISEATPPKENEIDPNGIDGETVATPAA